MLQKHPVAIWIDLEKLLISGLESRDCFVVHRSAVASSQRRAVEEILRSVLEVVVFNARSGKILGCGSFYRTLIL